MSKMADSESFSPTYSVSTGPPSVRVTLFFRLELSVSLKYTNLMAVGVLVGVSMGVFVEVSVAV